MQIEERNLNGKTTKKIKLATFEDSLKANRKKLRNIKLNKMIKTMKEIIWAMNILIDEYREMYHKTEYWEKKSTIDFDFDNWNTLKKVNGKLTRYFNDLLKVKCSLEKEKRK